MKLKHLFIAMAATMVAACSSDDGEAPRLDVVETELTAEAPQQTLTVEVDCNTPLTVVPEDAWVTAGTLSGNRLTLTLNENLGQNARTTTVSLQVEGGLAHAIKVTQQPYAFSTGHRYRLPVVFHVIYWQESIKYQAVEQGHLQKVIDRVNDLYATCGADLGVEFVMATETPDGVKLEEPGVNRVKQTETTIDCNKLMTSTDPKYHNLLWDTRRYVNILLYTFKDDGILGYSQFPWLPEPYELEGLEQTPKGADVTSNKYPQCVSINNKYVYSMPEGDEYAMDNIVFSVAHELGHFLGLYHAFNQLTTGNNVDVDTDYCTDTPPYNKAKYDTKLSAFLISHGKEALASKSGEGYGQMVMRTNSQTGEEFRSTNVMDYAVSDSDQFTAEQAARVKYVLHHSLFLPGPKDYSRADVVVGATRAAARGFEFTPQVIE